MRISKQISRYAVGETAKTTDYSMRVKQVKECKVETYFQPKTGNVKLGVNVEFRGLTDAEVPINPFHATLVDAENNRYTSTLAGCSPSLRSQRLSKDDKASGYVTFEIPASASSLQLEYTPFIVGRREQKLIFNLDR